MLVRTILEWDDEVNACSATCPELNFVYSFVDSWEAAIEIFKVGIGLKLERIPEQLFEI